MKKASRIILGLVFIATILFSIPALAREVRTSSIQTNGNIVEKYEGDREGATQIAKKLYEEYRERISSLWVRIDENSSKLCVVITPKKQRKCIMVLEILGDRKCIEKERKELEKEGWQITNISEFKKAGGKKETKLFVNLRKTIKY